MLNQIKRAGREWFVGPALQPSQMSRVKPPPTRLVPAQRAKMVSVPNGRLLNESQNNYET
jgi:hypothetical protein